MRPTRLVMLGALVGLAALTSACSSDSTPPGAARGASSASSSGSPTTVLTPEEAQLNKLLLTPDALGVTFTNGQLGAPMDTPQPCGQPDPRSVVHPTARVVGLLADYLDGVGVAENLSRFSSVDDAQRVMTLLRDGVSCGQGSINTSSGAAAISISPIQEISTQVDAVDAFAVVLVLPDSTKVTTVAARIDALVVVFQMGAKGTTGSIDPLGVAKQGVDKITQG